MADSTVVDVSKMKVVDLRKELKSRGLPHTGDKAELTSRLQAALAQDDHGDINLDSDEIDSDGVLEDDKLEDDDDKSQNDILDESGVETLNEELVLADQPAPLPPAVAKPRTLKRKITVESKEVKENKDSGSKKIVLNRATSVTPASKPEDETTDIKPDVANKPSDNKIKITAEIDAKTRLEMRAKRFGLPVKVSDEERKEARKQRFGQNTTTSTSTSTTTPGTLSENLDKLKQRAERFGQSVSKIMTDIELKEKVEKRKAKFGTVK